MFDILIIFFFTFFFMWICVYIDTPFFKKGDIIISKKLEAWEIENKELTIIQIGRHKYLLQNKNGELFSRYIPLIDTIYILRDNE